MKVKIEVELGNEAMQTPADVSRAVQKAIGQATSAVLFEPFPENAEGTISDENGNTVGRWEVS